MTPEQLEQLEKEQSKGIAAERNYKGYIKEFCEQKRVALFDAFRSLPLTATDELMEVKRMLYAIDTLETEVLMEIKTGEMASKALNDVEETQH